MSARLNYQTFLKYLQWLEQHGLAKTIVDDEGNERTALPKKGIDAHKRLVK
jgi:predicted transcriptional regulator